MAHEQESQIDPDEPFAVYVTNDLTKAEIVKNALNAEGIKAEVDAQTQGGLMELLDVRVLVRARGSKRAKTLIEKTETWHQLHHLPHGKD